MPTKLGKVLCKNTNKNNRTIPAQNPKANEAKRKKNVENKIKNTRKCAPTVKMLLSDPWQYKRHHCREESSQR
jgi:hypothetical protein